jgi:hypothetical protein
MRRNVPIFGAGLVLVSMLAFVFRAAAYMPGGVGSTPNYLPLVLKPATPTPSATATATATSVAPTATQTPTATATGAPAGVTILNNHSSYISTIGSLHIVGEVFNNSGGPIRFVRITANLFNASQQFVGTGFTYAHLDHHPNNEKTCFHVLISSPPANWTSYQFEAPTYQATIDNLPNLAVLSPSGSVTPSTGSYHLIGQVRNDNGTTVNYVQPVGTLYSIAGTVVGCSFAYVNSTHLAPGQTSSFDMLFTGRNYSDVANWRVQVDGDPQ